MPDPSRSRHSRLIKQIKYVMNKVSAAMHQSRHATSEHPVLAIDDVPIEQWLKSRLLDLTDEDTINGLVPAQGWLMDEDELTIAWNLLTPVQMHSADPSISTVVPLLICPDDMDLSCTVIVVEQTVDPENVTWKRFGLGRDSVNGIITSVQWSVDGQSCQFERPYFSAAVDELKRLSSEVWGR